MIPDDKEPLCCPDCGELTSDGQRCGECLSELCEYFYEDESARFDTVYERDLYERDMHEPLGPVPTYDIRDEGGQA